MLSRTVFIGRFNASPEAVARLGCTAVWIADQSTYAPASGFEYDDDSPSLFSGGAEHAHCFAAVHAVFLISVNGQLGFLVE